MKGCTHRSMIPCDLGVGSNHKEYSKAIAQKEHLSFAIFVFSMQKKGLKVLVMAFRPRSNMFYISFAMSMFSN